VKGTSVRLPLALSRVLVVGTAFAAVVTGPVAVASAAPAAADAASASQGLPALNGIVDVAARRILVGDLVAAAKFGTGAPIDDPAREQVVLNDARARAVQAGIDPDVTAAIFRDQIEANKVIQRGLYALWTAHPELAPTEKPDLVKVVRPLLDQITVDLINQIKATGTTQTSSACYGRLTAAFVQVDRARQFDALHTVALVRAVPSICHQ
jgi:chorismate mutase